MSTKKAWEIAREKSRRFFLSLTTRQKIANIIFLVVALGMGIYLKLMVWDIIILLIFTGVILNPISSKAAAFPAMIFLILSPFALIFKKTYLSEQMAIYAYYFLIMAAMMGIYELRKETKQEKN